MERNEDLTEGDISIYKQEGTRNMTQHKTRQDKTEEEEEEEEEEEGEDETHFFMHMAFFLHIPHTALAHIGTNWLLVIGLHYSGKDMKRAFSIIFHSYIGNFALQPSFCILVTLWNAYQPLRFTGSSLELASRQRGKGII